MQYDQERSSHGSDNAQTHEEMGDSLLDYSRCSDYGSADLIPFAFLCGDYLEVRLVDCKGIGMDRRL